MKTRILFKNETALCNYFCDYVADPKHVKNVWGYIRNNNPFQRATADYFFYCRNAHIFGVEFKHVDDLMVKYFNKDGTLKNSKSNQHLQIIHLEGTLVDRFFLNYSEKKSLYQVLYMKHKKEDEYKEFINICDVVLFIEEIVKEREC